MTNKAVLISVHSRKGGVGKTSIGMSTAIQLAALSKKVAFLDLDTLGTYLSQSLPFKADLVRENGIFKLSDDLGSRYSDKVFLVERFLTRSTRKTPKMALDSIGQ